MTTDNVKQHLSQTYGTEEKNWKRLSKKTLPNGDEVRIFQDKTNGITVNTVEAKDGSIFSEIHTELKDENIDNAIKLINQYYKDGTTPLETDPGYSSIPKCFNFCFFEDSNPDHSEALEDGAKSKNSQLPVTGFNLFFLPIFNKTSCIHLEKLLSPFLPDFLGEIEESSFCVHPEILDIYDDERIEGLADGTIPNVPYDQLIATLEQAGFTYNIKECMLKSLKGSQNAAPIVQSRPKL